MEKCEDTGSKPTNTDVISNSVKTAFDCTDGLHKVGISSIPVCVNTVTHNEFASASQNMSVVTDVLVALKINSLILF